MPTTRESSDGKPGDWHRFTVALDPADHAAVQAIADARGSKLAILVREAVRFWLSDQQRRRAS